MTLAVGALSGTSADGIDVALVEITARTLRIRAAHTTPYRSSVRRLLAKGATLTAEQVASLHRVVAEDFARAIQKLLKAARVEPRKVAIIGSHGQTIWHTPRVMSLQVGSPAVLAARTGIPVAADFRPDDIAVGGEGAPFVPLLDAQLAAARSVGRRIGVLNLGGIANVTVVEDRRVVAAYDIGPANGPLDAAARLWLNRAMDRDGRVARRGRILPALLERIATHPYFRRKPPKSTGLEEFGDVFVAGIKRRSSKASAADILATLTALSAMITVRDLMRLKVDEVYASGGGMRNPILHDAIECGLAPIPFHDTRALGVDPDFKEALLFAWLGWKRLRGEEVDLRAVTGARRPKVLGGLWLP